MKRFCDCDPSPANMGRNTIQPSFSLPLSFLCRAYLPSPHLRHWCPSPANMGRNNIQPSPFLTLSFVSGYIYPHLTSALPPTLPIQPTWAEITSSPAPLLREGQHGGFFLSVDSEQADFIVILAPQLLGTRPGTPNF